MKKCTAQGIFLLSGCYHCEAAECAKKKYIYFCPSTKANFFACLPACVFIFIYTTKKLHTTNIQFLSVFFDITYIIYNTCTKVLLIWDVFFFSSSSSFCCVECTRYICKLSKVYKISTMRERVNLLLIIVTHIMRLGV